MFVIFPTRYGWLAFFAAMAGMVVLKDLRRAPRRPLPQWPFVIVLLTAMFLLVIALLMPSIVMTGEDLSE